MKVTDLFLEDLQKLMAKGCANVGCTDPNHGHHDRLQFHARCHPGEGFFFEVHRGADYVTCRCRKCLEVVVRLHLAQREGATSFPA